MTAHLKIIVINNYKENEKARQAMENLTRCTAEQLEMLDYRIPDLQEQICERNPDMMILTGSNFMLSKPDTRLVFKHEMDLLQQLDTPALGICFGHQLIGAAHGSRIIDIGHTIKAFKEVTTVVDDPIFDGLPGKIIVAESHRQALSQVPEGFRHLAESPSSRVEAIAHETRPIYGVQFHPERSDENHPHGQAIIQNFVKLVAKS